MRVTVSRRLNSNSAFAQQVKRKSAKKVAAAIEQIKTEVQAEVNRIVQAELVTDRSGDRRKKGTRKLLNSFYVEAEWDGKSFPVKLTVKSRANSKKVGALEYGSGLHGIRPKNGQWLKFPSPNATGRATEVGMGQRIVRLEKGGSITPRQVRQAYGKKIVSPRTGNLIKTPYVKARMVKHPGNRAYKFMERGLEIALKKLKQRL